MASETHLTGKFWKCLIFFFFRLFQTYILFIFTVLFSNEKNLVSKETPSEVARRVFKSYDPDGNNFIPNPVLQDVLSALELVSEPE